MKPNLKRERK